MKGRIIINFVASNYNYAFNYINYKYPNMSNQIDLNVHRKKSYLKVIFENTLFLPKIKDQIYIHMLFFNP